MARRLVTGVMALSTLAGLAASGVVGVSVASATSAPACSTTPASTTTCTVTLHLTSGTWTTHNLDNTAPTPFPATATAGFTATENPVTGLLRTGSIKIPVTPEANRGSAETIIFTQATGTKATGSMNNQGQLSLVVQLQANVHITKPLKFTCLSPAFTVSLTSSTPYDATTGDVTVSATSFTIPDFTDVTGHTCGEALGTLNKTFPGSVGNKFVLNLHGALVVPPKPIISTVTTLSVTPKLPAAVGGSVAGQTTQLSVKVVPGGTTGVNGGTVQFEQTTKPLGAPALVTPGSGTTPATASMSTTALPVGTDNLTAVYSGYGKFIGSTSTSVGYQVAAAPVVSISLPSPITIGVASTRGAKFPVVVSDPGNGPALAHVRLTFVLSGHRLTSTTTFLYVCTNPNYTTACTRVLTAGTGSLKGHYGGSTSVSTFSLVPGQSVDLYFHLYFSTAARFGPLTFATSLTTTTSGGTSVQATLSSERAGTLTTSITAETVSDPISIFLGRFGTTTTRTIHQGQYQALRVSLTTTAIDNGKGPTPTGAITVYRNLINTATKTPIDAVPAGSTFATLVTWPTGTYQITASYGGDYPYYSATSALVAPVTLHVTSPYSGVPYLCTATLLTKSLYATLDITSSSSPTVPPTALENSTVSFGDLSIDGKLQNNTLSLSSGEALTGLSANLLPSGSASGAALSTAKLAALTYPYEVAVDPKNHRAYVTSPAAGMVTVINEITGTIVGTVTVGTHPFDIAADPTEGSTGVVYVSNTESDTVSVIDASTDTVTATIPVGTDPAGVAVNVKTHDVYVANSKSQSVSVIDPSEADKVVTIKTGTGIAADPTGVAVDPTTGTTGTIYLIYGGATTRKLTTISGATNRVAGTLVFTSAWKGSNKTVLAVDPRTHKVYIPSTKSLLVISGGPSGPTDTRKITLTKSLHPGIAVDPTAGTAGMVYVELTTAKISEIKGTGTALTSSKTVAIRDPYGLAFDLTAGPDGTLVVAAFGRLSIDTVNLESGSVTTITIGAGVFTGTTAEMTLRAAAVGSVVLGSSLGDQTVGISTITFTAPYPLVGTVSIGCRPASQPATIGTVDVLAKAKPAVTTQPTAQSANVGTTATFTAAASGEPAPTVQWQSSTDGGSTWTNVTGATSTSYTTPATTAADNGTQYRSVFTNTSGTVTTTAVTLTVDVPPTVTTQPTSAAVTAGTPVSFTAAATARPAASVQWQVSTDGGKTFTNVPGATSTTLTFAPTKSQSGNEYRAVFTNDLGSATSNPATLTVTTTGYRLFGSDGAVYDFGTAPFYGSMGGKPLNQPIVGAADTPTGKGYWEVASDGGIFAFGTAGFYGSMGGQPLNQPVVGMAATPTGKGYWEVAKDGGIFAFGTAGFYGSMGGKPLNQPIVGMTPTPTGKGYWLVASDGGIFAFGSAQFFGSTGSMTLAQPITAMAAAPTGQGYWLVAKDGGIFAFGTAPFEGSAAGGTAGPYLSMAAAPTGKGYWLAGAFGAVTAFGTAPLAGSMAGQPLNAPVVAITAG